MNAVELAKVYNPAEFEEKIYREWNENGSFLPADSSNGKDPFVIVIPPPNVTGVLHMGHGLNNTLQDVLIRYNRMLGRPTLWVPGSDHAGIATQHVVERELKSRGTSRHEIGREKFVDETWKVKDRHHTTIVKQLQKIGSSCDWSRERFTLDEGLSKAVREVFVSLYERGLIYKGNYLINWCATCGTALSDDEVEHREKPGKMYKIRYPYADGSGYIEIATTRPETMLGDVAVAVNPEDDRYKDIVGKKVILPLTDREIPIIADAYVSMEFGTGMVKITPAHDPNDYEIGKRHNLEQINILSPDGTLNASVPESYRGMTVESARAVVLDDLRKENLLVDIHDHVHQIGHCYRCDTVIEPYLSDQWFVSMRSMADKALQALHSDDIRFYPKKWENTYVHWLTNIRDWCISRQLWWGHRIPVWYCNDCEETMVLRDAPTTCQSCGSSSIRQEEDVLDTWFSSWLWPFSTLGWPDSTDDLSTFFPTSTLVTGYDIIFFWVARMIMASLEFMDKAPFRDICITGLVRDKQGRKMSKSLGNGIDPLKVVDLYGADAMKFTLCFLAAQGNDILLDMDTFKMGSRFANKVWNATRFLLMNLEGKKLLDLQTIELRTIDKWIYHRFNKAAAEVEKAMKVYRFNDATQAVYDFFWNDFCDWYIEASKASLYSDSEDEKARAVTLLLDILAESMRLLHPFISFLTEEIYQKLPNTEGYVISEPYPEFTESRCNDQAGNYFSTLQEVVKKIRTLRSEFSLPPEKKVRVVIKTDEGLAATQYLIEQKNLITKFINASEVKFYHEEALSTEGSVPVAGMDFEAFVFIRDAIDVPQEIAKLEKERSKVMKQLEGVNKKLANEKFLQSAPETVIEKEKGKHQEFTEKIQKVDRHLAVLKEGNLVEQNKGNKVKQSIDRMKDLL
ncbi:MAG: valine--tRNA ligase [Bacteroidetes bacterium]|nr:valine--tRNA ligase [Bacteroidota bacterium]